MAQTPINGFGGGALAKKNVRLPPEVNRALFVKNLPFKISSEEMYDIFGKYGSIRQIRVGTSNETRGTAYVVFDDIHDAKAACEHLSGFNVSGRYLIIVYHQPQKVVKKEDLKKKKEDIENLKAKYNVSTTEE